MSTFTARGMGTVAAPFLCLLVIIMSLAGVSEATSCLCSGSADVYTCSGNMIVDGSATLCTSTWRYISGDVEIQDLDSNLTAIDDAFPDLQQIGGSLIIAGQPQLTSIRDSFQNLRSCGKILITGNPALTQIDGFSSLQSAGGIDINWNLGLGSITGFQNLINITANGLRIDYCGHTTITNFPSLRFINGSLDLTNNFNITEMLNVFPSLETVTSKLSVSGSPKLTTLTGFGALRRVQSLYIFSSRLLQYIPPFFGIDTFTYDLVIKGLGVTSLAGRFPNLKSVPNRLSITSNNYLTTLAGFAPSLESVSDLTLQYNPVLRYFADFDQLKNLTRFTSIGNPLLLDYHGLCKPLRVFDFYLSFASAPPASCNTTVRGVPLTTTCAPVCACRRCVPPQLSSARFRSNGRAIDVVFDSPTNQGSTSCSDIWQNSAALFGSDAVCAWQSDTMLTIFFPTVPTLVSGTSIALNSARGAVRAKGAMPADPFAVGSVPVDAPLDPVPPVAQLAIPGLSSCSSVIRLDASASRAIGSATFSWSSPDATLNGLLSSSTASVVNVDPAQLSPGTPYTVQVSLIDRFSNLTASTQRSFVIPNQAVPIVSLGVESRTIVASQPVTVFATASDPCSSSSSRLTFAWSITPNAGLALSSLQTLNQRDLILPANFFPVGQTFTATLTVGLLNSPGLTSSASVDLVVRSAPIQVGLGGIVRQIPYTSLFPLRATVLSGGDPSKPFVYAWSCCSYDPSDPSDACTSAWCPLSDALALETSSQAVINSSLLTSGENVLVTVTVSQADAQRNGTATTTIVRASTDIPVITLATPARVNVNQPNPITSLVNTTSTQPLKYAWSLIDGPAGFALNASTLASPITLDSANLVIRRNALDVGRQYTFQLTVTDENGLTSSAQASFTTNVPPLQGTLVASPSEGLAATTPFLLTFADWIDLDSASLVYPLHYKLWYEQAGTAVILYAGTSPSVTTTLPPGDQAAANALTLFASVTDSDGGETRTSMAVVVNPPPALNLTSDLITQVVAESETSEDAQTYLASVASLISSASDPESAFGLSGILLGEAISTGQQLTLTPAGLSRTTSLYALLTQLDMSEEENLQALNATQDITLLTKELGAADDDLLASVVGVLGNVLIKVDSLRSRNDSSLVVDFGSVAPEVLAPAVSVELSKAVCGQDVDPFSSSSMSLSVFTGCCQRSFLPGATETDGTRASFSVPSAINDVDAGKCPDFFMTSYSLSPFPRAPINAQGKALGSQVYGLVAISSAGDGAVDVSNLDEEILISIPVSEDSPFTGDSSRYDYVCAFLDTNNGSLTNGGAQWSGSGCRFVQASTDEASGRIIVDCACNHLTDFGLLVSAKPSSSDDVAIPIAVAVCVTIAVVVILVAAVTITTLVILRRRRLNRQMSTTFKTINIDRYDGLTDLEANDEL